jgi:hypothetical protein
MNSITYTITQQTLGELFSRTFKTDFLYEFLVDEDSAVMDILMLGITNPDAVDPSALEGHPNPNKWMEMLFSAIEHTYPHDNIEIRMALAAKAAIHFRGSMTAETWFGFVSAPCKTIRAIQPKLLTLYIEALIAAALASGNRTIMIDLLGLSIPKSDLLYYSGPFPGAMLSYVNNHPDLLSLFNGAPSKLIAKIAIKHEIWGLGSLLDLEDRGPVFTNELGI